MKAHTNTKVIGAFVLGALLLIIVVFVIFGSGKLFKDTYLAVIYFQGDAIGLRKGAPVKVRGVDLGTVKTITPVYDKEGNIQVEVLVELIRRSVSDAHRLYEGMTDDEFFDLLMEKGLRARLETMSLVTGVRYIKLDFFPEFPARLVGLRPDIWEIPSIPTTQEQLEQTFRTIVTKLGEVEWDSIEEDFEGLLTGLKDTLEMINQTAESIELGETIASLNKNLAASEEMFNKINSKIDPLMDEQVESLVSDFKGISEAVVSTLDRSQKLMTRLENIVVDDRYEIQVALKEFAETSRSLRVLLDYIQQNPESVIRGKKDRRQP